MSASTHSAADRLPHELITQSRQTPNERLWHDPAHVLAAIFANRQPKLFGAFLTHSGPSSKAMA
jgi:hypothetical protein